MGEGRGEIEYLAVAVTGSMAVCHIQNHLDDKKSGEDALFAF